MILTGTTTGQPYVFPDAEEAEAASAVNRVVERTLGSVTITSPVYERELSPRRAHSPQQGTMEWRQYLYSWLELATMDTTNSSPMLWDGFLPTDDIAIFAALKGRGKTTLVLQVAIAIVRGDEDFLGRKLIAPNRRVLYVKFEGSGKTRLARLMKRYGLAYPGLQFLAASRLSVKEVIAAIEELQAESPFDMVIIDCLGNMFRGEQNSNSDAQEFLRQFDSLTSQTLLFFIHHLNKAANNNSPHDKYIQGAGGFVQRARTVLMLSDEVGCTDRYLHVAFEDDMSDEFKQDALVLNFDREHKMYSSIGMTKPVEAINAFSPVGGSKAKEKELDLRESTSIGKVYKRYEMADLASVNSNSGTMARAIQKGLTEGWLVSRGKGKFERVEVKVETSPVADSGSADEPNPLFD